MKIIEALKELPLIEKRVQKQVAQIQQYSSYLTGFLSFETEDRQRKEVEALLQSNQDLVDRYEELTNKLALTNATVEVDIDGDKRTIREWITFKNKTANLLKNTFSALNNVAGQQSLNMNQSQGKVSLETGVQLKRAYKEEDKLKAENVLQNKLDKIDATLEIVNVNTDLAA